MKVNVFLHLEFVLVLVTVLNFRCTPSMNSLTTPTNLLGLVGNNPELSAFYGLLEKVPAAGKLLGGKTPVTLLAPTNAAIAELGQDALGKLTGSKDGLKQLGDIIRKHIVPGVVSPDEITAGNLKSVTGDSLRLGEAKLIGDPITADNGIIQVVDKVLR